MEPNALKPTLTQLERAAQAHIAFEEDPHRAALEDNPDTVKINARTWAAIGFLSLAFGPAIGLPFVSFASIVVSVSQELNGYDSYVWCIGAWSLASAVSFSLAGPLSDVFGRRLPILFGQAVIVVGSVVAGTAKNIDALIAGEALTGLGTGFLYVSYAGVPEMLPNKWRSLGLGLLEVGISVPWGLASALVANSLYENISWRWVFYLGVIVGTVAFVGTALTYFPTARPRGDYTKSRWQELQEIDFGGLLIFASGLTTLLIGITWGGSTAHPWNSSGTIAPIVLGVVVLILTFFYEAWVKHPVFPLDLLAQFRQFSLLLIIVFIAGMNFYSMVPLQPQGALYMFSPNPTKIGIYSLPNNIMQSVMGTIAPMLAHKLGYIKWQLIAALAVELAFTAALAGAVSPNHLPSYIALYAIGVPMFPYITILTYAIASLHMPHSRLGVAMGLAGTFRAVGGAVGNSIFQTILNDRFDAYVSDMLAPVAIQAGVAPTLLPALIPAAIQYNLGTPGNGLLDIAGVTPATAAALQASVRDAWGHAFKIVFYCTIPFGFIALVCAFFVEDPTVYLTNHIQEAMGKGEDTTMEPGKEKQGTEKRSEGESSPGQDRPGNEKCGSSSHVETPS